jgi:hypothetical protein
LKGFDYFLKQNELGKTDSKNMNRLLQMMDENGHIDKQTILEQIFVTAADADATRLCMVMICQRLPLHLGLS